MLRLLAARFGYLAMALLKSPGNALVDCGLEAATMTASNISAPVMISRIRLGTLYSFSVLFIMFSFGCYTFLAELDSCVTFSAFVVAPNKIRNIQSNCL